MTRIRNPDVSALSRRAPRSRHATLARRWARLTASALGAIMPLSVAAQTTDPNSVADGDIPLTLGVPRAQTHAATERVVYSTELPPDGIYLIELDQRGLDLTLTIEGPQGAETRNSPLARDAAEYALLEYPQAGTYRIIVESDEYTRATGGHELLLTELSAPAPEEIAAWRLIDEAGSLHAAGGEDAWVAAAETYRTAAELWRATGRKRLEADARFSAATVDYWQLYDWAGAAGGAARSAALYSELGERGLEANAIHLQAASLIESALGVEQSSETIEVSAEARTLFDEALDLLARARETQAELGHVYDLGLIVNNQGYALYNTGDLRAARERFLEAAALLENLGEWSAELNPRFNLASLDVEHGHLANAVDSFERILEILPDSGLEGYRTITLDNLGAAQAALGNADEALRLFSDSLALQTQLGDKHGVGRSLRWIGEIYYGFGELELARQYLSQALPMAEETNDGPNLEASYRTLGNVAYSAGDYTEALESHRLALESAALPSDRVRLQLLISKDLRALGRDDDALSFARAAYDAAREGDSEVLAADADRELGHGALALGRSAEAAERFERASATYSRLGLAGRNAEALHGLATAARLDGNLERSAAHGEAALQALESLRVRVADPELRALFSAARRTFYEDQIRLYMELSEAKPETGTRYQHRAFETSERSRARMTIDLLREAAVDLREGADPDLKQRERALYEQLAERRYQRDRLLAEPTPAPAALTPILADLAALENELNLVSIELRRSSPRLASLDDSRSLAVDEIQSMLGPDTVRLQYSLGTDVSYVWAVTAETIDFVELAGGATIEAAVRRAVTTLGSHPATRRSEESLSALSALVLEPVTAHLDKQRLVLALDDALQYVPFGVLPLSRPDASRSATLSEHTIVEIPSMTAIAALRERGESGQASKTLAIFADPVLDLEDPRLDAARPLLASTSPATNFVGRSSVTTRLTRLPSSGYEADAISALVPPEQKLVAAGFAASRRSIVEGDLNDYRYIHFATHGLIDSRYPGLSALALSQFDDEAAAQDGFLRLPDIYNLDLNADLVVLSACETALGREIRGDGLVGLTQGFMYAGARSVVASLWQVPDRATSHLMTRFYEYLLDDELEPAEALRRAQLSTASERRWRDPYFWGGFILVGDWR